MVRSRLLTMLKPGTRMVSHDYDFGEWTPDLAFEMDAPGKTVGRGERSKVFYWVVPGNAAGKWRWQLTVDGKLREFDLDLNQKFQVLSGTLMADGRKLALEEARLVGEQISFSATDDSGARYSFSGRIINHAIEGDARVARGKSESRIAWNAVRTVLREPAHVGLPPPVMPEIR
jgi:hypothetical protein